MLSQPAVPARRSEPDIRNSSCSAPPCRPSMLASLRGTLRESESLRENTPSTCLDNARGPAREPVRGPFADSRTVQRKGNRR